MSEAATVWQPSWGQEGEYSGVIASNITDPVVTTINITDPVVTTTIITDTGLDFSQIPSTIFSFDAGQ